MFFCTRSSVCGRNQLRSRRGSSHRNGRITIALENFVVSNDPELYESWPDVCRFGEDSLFCLFNEGVDHGSRGLSRIMYTISHDRGRTWSRKKALTKHLHSPDGTVSWDCARVTHLGNGELIIVCTFIDRAHSPHAEVHMWRGNANTEIFSEPRNLHLEGIVPDRLLITSSGRWIIACHDGDIDGFPNLQQRLYYSDDEGETWEGPVVVAKDERYNLCEASILEVEPGHLVCFMREESALGLECFCAQSMDDGLTWSDLYTIPLDGCHRPVAGFLSTGEIMITYRYRQGGQRGWLGSWTQNTFLALTDVETVTTGDRKRQATRIMPLNYDRSPESDLGYTGWVEFGDGEIYVVDYIRDLEPKCYIKGTSLRREDIGGI